MTVTGLIKSNQRCFGTALLAIALLLAMLGVVAVALLSTRYGWSVYLELLSHFQVQYAVLVWALWVGLWFLRRRIETLVGLFLCAVLTLPLLAWYLPPKFLSSPSPAELRIFSANLNVKNHHYAEVLAQIQAEHPDIVVVMEVDEAWVNQLNTLGDRFPYQVGMPNPYNLGLMVYSRYPLINSSIQEFGTAQNISAIAELSIAGKPVSILATHPLPPVRNSFFHARNRQLDQIGQFLSDHAEPAIVVGDLNITPWSPYYKRFQRQTGMDDARRGFGILPTWAPTGYRKIPPILAPLFALPIDHCLVSPSLTVQHFRIGQDTGSDHRPVIVDISL